MPPVPSNKRGRGGYIPGAGTKAKARAVKKKAASKRGKTVPPGVNRAESRERARTRSAKKARKTAADRYTRAKAAKKVTERKTIAKRYHY
jgi:hypothetical protein